MRLAVLQMQCYAGCEGEDCGNALKLVVLQMQCYAGCEGEECANAMRVHQGSVWSYGHSTRLVDREKIM